MKDAGFGTIEKLLALVDTCKPFTNRSAAIISSVRHANSLDGVNVGAAASENEGSAIPKLGRWVKISFHSGTRKALRRLLCVLRGCQ